MLAPKPKARRFLEMTQFVLTLASACAVVDASRIQTAAPDRPGYHTSVPQPRQAARDRSLGDLARVERKRREAEQHASRRGLELDHALEQRQLPA
ncbi:MAG TPA: hypothetical protein VM692_12505 [Gammaproteobacteria bacterium]|nr:hypothetical protein [Gammaproteobacteria bacterium]